MKGHIRTGGLLNPIVAKESGLVVGERRISHVFVLDDKHPETQMVMGELQSRGFPTIGMLKNGQMMNYEGPRDASSMMDTMMSE